MATIKQISELCGVSRGTVDRVLNNRGRVSPEKERLIRNVAKQLGYIPNRAGKGLAARKKSYTVSVLLISEGNPFFDDVISGVFAAQEEFQDYGVTVKLKLLRGYNVRSQLSALDELARTSNAIIFNPIDETEIADKINRLSDKGIHIYTVNTDIKDSKRLCYIGSDYMEGGRVACGMLGLLTNGSANIGIITGAANILGHKQRIDGFLEIMNEKYPEFKLYGITETQDDDKIGYANTVKLLKNNEEIDALYLCAAGVLGVCRAVKEFPNRKIKLISFDNIPQTQRLMEDGVIQATICQQPVAQGYESVKAAAELLVNGTPTKSGSIIVKNEIHILENL